MPSKMKSHKTSARRLRLSSRGKIVRRQCNVRHLLTHRSPKRKRNLGRNAVTTTRGYVKMVRVVQGLKVPRKHKQLHNLPKGEQAGTED